MSNNFQRTHDSSESGAEAIQDNYDVPATLAEFVSRAREIFKDKDLPADILKDVVASQHATCERLRHRILSSLWELEEAKRWSRCLEHSLTKSKKEFEGAEAGLHLWVEAANKQIAAQQASGSDTVKEEALNFAEMQFEELRVLASARGLTEEDSVNIQWP